MQQNSEVVSKQTTHVPLSNKFICKYWFKSINENNYECRCGHRRVQKKGTGKSNLIQHLTSSHSNYLETMRSHPDPSTITNLFSPKALNTYRWMDWIINDNLPFNFIEKPRTRNYSLLKEMSVDSFMSNINTT